jgi:chromosome partitioning protein
MILAFLGQKGGTGKSTLAICVAAELEARGYTVLLVDADPQQSVVTWHDVAKEGEHVVPTVVAMTESLHLPHQVPRLAAAYQHTVIDTPAKEGGAQRSAMMVADVGVLPCGPSGLDVWALEASIATLQEAIDYRPALKAVIVINKVRTGTTNARGAREALSEGGLPVLEAELGMRQAYQESVAAGLGVRAYAPRDPASREIKALVTELLKLGGAKR